MTRWSWLAAAIGLEVSATLALRQVTQHPAWVALVVLGYGGAFLCLAMVLRAGTPIGVAYGIWAAFGVALTALFAAALYGEPLTWMVGLGILLVIGGVLLVEFGSHASTTPTAEEAAQ